ncbi:MAG TPA: SAM-dependent methyltransferase [Chitinophagaceae bacterium]|nr:SAM-dependent methyltransferase [Chitinophagaceae bacterium]MCB9054501.1 SAM-dependent methyltransferase [Chitinophagales bacterium]HPG11366.1 SAM-dependent methyltransferase [Chitinophagaceae bacterium]HRX93119.1 SAM-dependent methyltransferase [Chitinophagaceae bacterium]
MAVVYLIPAVLHPEGYHAISDTVITAIRSCEVFFTENERTTRRYFKQLWKEMVIDDYEWHTISDELQTTEHFRKSIQESKTIGIVSEAGCPGVADPGQKLVEIAQSMNAEVKPLTGPSSLLLALMASGMNGQQFQFVGYLPIDSAERKKALKNLEEESARKKSTQLFIETPYRNNRMLEDILKSCHPETKICLAVNLTGPDESVKTKKVSDWKQKTPDLNKQQVVFLLYAG